MVNPKCKRQKPSVLYPCILLVTWAIVKVTIIRTISYLLIVFIYAKKYFDDSFVYAHQVQPFFQFQCMLVPTVTFLHLCPCAATCWRCNQYPVGAADTKHSIQHQNLRCVWRSHQRASGGHGSHLYVTLN